MSCKDSDVFALESFIEKTLNQGEWVDSSQLGKSIEQMKDPQYQVWAATKRSKEPFHEEFAGELFIDDVMDRLCTLFPMKYKKENAYSSLSKANDSTGKFKYKRIWGFDK